MLDRVKAWFTGAVQGDEALLNNDEDRDDFEDEAEDDAGNEEPDLDEETAAIVEREAEKRVAAYQATVRQGLQSAGLDWTDTGPVIRNAQQARERLGFAEVPAAPPPPAAQAQQDDLPDEPPDMYLNPKEYHEWILAHAERRVEAKLQALHQRSESLESVTMAREEQDALQTARQILQESDLRLVVDHPDFEAQYLECLRKFPVKAWRDPNTVGGISGMLMMNLDPAKLPQRRQTRDEGGRFRSPEAERADAQRRSLGATGASRETARTSNQGYSEMDRMAAEYFGWPLEKAKTMGNTDPDTQLEGYQRYQERAARNKR